MLRFFFFRTNEKSFMKSNRIAGFLFAVLFLTVCSAFTANAQASETADEREVPIIKQLGSHPRAPKCWFNEDAVIDEEKFKKILADKECSYLENALEVDFAKQTLIGFSIGGDCFMRTSTKVFRRDETKKYNVRIKNIWGGCRAGGWVQGWLVIEKIPADYAVEFTVIRADKTGKPEEDDSQFLNLKTPAENKPAETLETRSIDLKNCIQTIFNTQFVIKDNETYLKTIRADASRDWCLKNLEKIDFNKYTLLGKSFSSGYCRIPLGLEYKAAKDEAAKRYLVTISYIDPRGAVCRARSQYDLWLLVPKLPADYGVKFEIKPEWGESGEKIPLWEIHLTNIGRIAPKGRVQDKDYNQLPVIDALLAQGKQAIPFLINKLDDETKIPDHVMDYWSEIYVGDVALIILADFFLDKDWKNSTVKGLKWDEFLMRGDNKEITAEELLRNYIKKYGRKKIKERWQQFWAENQENIYWDDAERAFKTRN